MFSLTKYKKIYFGVSSTLLILGLSSLLLWGLRPSIDFTGGSIYEVKVPGSQLIPIEIWEEAFFKVNLELDSVRSSGVNQYLLKFGSISNDTYKELRTVLEATDGIGGVEDVRFETVGPSMGKELLYKTLVAVVLSAGFILLYVGWQCKDFVYGVCAILGMFHDSLILLGTFSFLGHFLGVEVDTLFVTAVLTTLSLSVHDTVVVFNSVREKAREFGSSNFEKAINVAIAETLTRSINNSLTIIFMLTALVVLGGVTIRWFAVALLVGTIVGTYSSTFIAAPLLLVVKKLAIKFKK